MPHKLLLADDSVTIQRVIELTFADEDMQVVAVGDGEKAIASHPGATGRTSCWPTSACRNATATRSPRSSRANHEFAHIPVLLLTGAFEPIDEARARAVGCDGVLVKPFEPQMVISRVKDLLAGRRPAGLWSTTPAQPAATAGVSGAGCARRRSPRRPRPDRSRTISIGSTRRLPAWRGLRHRRRQPRRWVLPFLRTRQLTSTRCRSLGMPRRRPSTSFAEGIADWDPDLHG